MPTTGDIREVVREIVIRHDPIHIGYTPDEYDPEVERIVGAVEVSRSAEELADSIHEIFVAMFNETIAGTRERYAAIASEVWRVCQQK